MPLSVIFLLRHVLGKFPELIHLQQGLYGVVALADERTLGERYNTVESLLEVDQLRRFAQYMSKQKDNRKRHDNALRYAK